MNEKKPLWQVVYPAIAILLFVALNMLMASGFFGELIARPTNYQYTVDGMKKVSNIWLSTETTDILKVVSYVVPDAISIIALIILFHFIKRVRKEDNRSEVLPAIVFFLITPLLITGAYALFSHVSHERRRDIMPIHSTNPGLSDDDVKTLGLD